MAKGTNRVQYLGSAGYATGQEHGLWDFIYTTSTTRDSLYNVGDVVYLPNGKGFVYCKSGGACYTGLGNIFYNAIPATGVDYALIAAAAAIGDRSVVMDAVLTHTADDLRGGNILLKIATGSNDSELQCRGIVGNSAAAAAAEVTIYLDAPLTSTLTTASYAYCMPSPYSDVRWSENSSLAGWCSHVGVAAVYVSAADTYHWEQFRGRCMGISLHDDPGTSGDIYKRGLVWRYQGSLQYQGTTAILGLNQQQAGYAIDNNTAANGTTEVMLTGNV